MTPRLRLLVALASLIFFVAHLRALPHTLEDIDSINFALGVEHFDVANHQPHPPGYPVFVGLARMSTKAIGWIEPGWDRDRRAAAGLAVWGLVAGTLAIWTFTEFWMAVGLTPTIAFLASLVAVMSPLFWFTAARPLTDTPALVISIAVATGFFRGLRAFYRGEPGALRTWIIAAAASGFIIGIRSQTMWLTGPLLCWAAGELVARARWRDAGRLLGAALGGVLVWAVPLVVLSGGLGRYLEALRHQGTQDFVGIEMLATSPTWQLLRQSLSRTFLQPWQGAALANVVMLLAVIGTLRLASRGRRVLAAISLVFWPYLVFHLTFHETATLRYALPLVVPIAGLAVIGLSMAGTRVAVIGGTAAAVWSLIVIQPRLLAYATEGAPIFRAFQDMQRALPNASPRPDLHMHHQVYWGIQRVADWYRPYWNPGTMTHPGSREWLGVIDHFVRGDDRPVWFLGDVTRNDMRLVDFRSRRLGGHYVLPAEIRQLVGGARLDSLDWWVIERPGWMLGAGWSLTPEIAGVTAQDGATPNLRPADAYVRRTSEPVRLLFGARDLDVDPRTTGAAVVTVDLDGRTIDQSQVNRGSPWLVRWIDLPAGVLAGPTPYARLTFHVSAAAPGEPAPVVGLEQFDAAPVGTLMWAFGDGWYEQEEVPANGRLWRWTSAKSVVEIKDWNTSTTLLLSGESPLRYYDHAPTVIVRAGETELRRFSPSTNFTESIPLPADALAISGGQVTIETNLTFSPFDRGQSADRRKLGLLMYSIDVK